MSLLDSFSSGFHLMDRRTAPDGEGGFTTSWEEGAAINISLKFDTSMEARRAEQDGMKSVYTLLCPRGCMLRYHDVVRRDSDGVTFRITSNAGEQYTPDSSALNLTAVTAEKWELTA